MAAGPAIYLVACSNADAQEHLQRTVVEGVSHEEYAEYTSVGFGENVSIWGVKGTNEGTWSDINAGDYLFFYTGDETFTQVAKVLATEHNEPLANYLWPGFDDTWGNIIYCDDPVPVTIDGAEIADYAGYSRNHVLGFQPLREQAATKMVDEYGSVAGYINAHRTDDKQITSSTETDAEDTGGSTDTSLAGPELSSDRFPEIARQLETTNQVVLYGPPGTGKTYTATQFAKWWLHNTTETPTEAHLRTVTFHPSYTYEDFIEGLTANAGDNGVSYDLKPGKFKELCSDAKDAYDQTPDGESAPKYILIIDEINRGNLAQIFGETITLLEQDKRGSTSVDLAHSGEPFTIPPNVYVIGTMNTADRSIALVDAAMRRRFRFIDFPPEYGVVRSHFGFADAAAVDAAATGNDLQALQALSLKALQRFNETIIELPDLGKGKQLGHSYLMVDQNSEKALVEAWRYEILPLLEEYFYGQLGRIRQDLFSGNGSDLVDWEREEINDFDAQTLRASLRAIVEA
jgi:5-methylcytosine-specific restriction protein B